MRVQVSAVYTDERDHPIVGLYRGGPSTAPKPPGGLGIGRHFRPGELEVIPTPE